ncbi:hypothetical protein DFH09DRAFT_259304 [Mycena vulgaris]|nr:hypothetical protein DFH09DRAFT_259304 [Mycena vulgaris]
MPMSPTAASKLPRSIQSPAQRDRSKSLSVDRPPVPRIAPTSNSVSTSSSGAGRGGQRNAGRFLGLGKGSEKDAGERERQRIRESKRGAPFAAELLTLHEQTHSPTDYQYQDDSYSGPPGSPQAHSATAAPRARACGPSGTSPPLLVSLIFLARTRRGWGRGRGHAAAYVHAEPPWRGRPLGSEAERMVRAFDGEHVRFVADGDG